MESHHLTSNPYLLLILPIAVLTTFLLRTLLSRPSLSHLPGPLITRYTRLPLKLAVLRGQRNTWIHAQHATYGSVVRLSPNEVSLSSVGAAKQLYRMGSPFLKTAFYGNFTGNTPEQNLFVMNETVEHGERRRLLARNFAERWVGRMEPFIMQKVRLAVERMRDEGEREGRVDVFKWFTFMASDVVGEASFGESFRMLETGKKNQYIKDLELIGKRGSLRAEFNLVVRMLTLLPFGFSKELTQSSQRMLVRGRELIQTYWGRLQEQGGDHDAVKPTLLTKMYAAVEDGQITARQLEREASGFIVAGTDTTAITATYAVWLLALHPDREQDLIREVAALPENFDDEHLKTLRVLGNVLNETLRLRSAVGQALPRAVPPEGATFEGRFVPGGMTVGVPAWSIHRNPDVWPEPEAFKPERWDHVTKEMKDSFVPFGGGSRVCLGKHFAQLELRHALANFYRTFESGVKPSAAEGFTADDMEQVAFFLTPPKGKRCLVERRK